MPTLSNEAEELHRMCVTVRSYGNNNQTSIELANLFGVEAESHDYFFFISAIRLRFERFLQVVNQSVSNERHRSTLQGAVRHLRSFTEMKYWQASWRDTRTNVFNETHLTALDMSGGGLATVAPVTVLGDDERLAYVDELRSALGEIEDAADFVAQMVAHSMRTAIKMIELFDIFGSAAIGEKLFQTHALVTQAAETAPAEQKTRYKKAAAVIAIILGGIIYADSAYTAVENFYTRANTAVEQLFLANPPEQKLLAPPQNEAPQAGDDGAVIKKGARIKEPGA